MGGLDQISAVTGEWCVVQTRPQRERAVAERLAAQGFGHFFPVERVRRVYANRREVVERALYPTYLFAAYDDEYARHSIRQTRDVSDLLVVHGHRQERLAADVASLARALELDPFATAEDFEPGQRIAVIRGAFLGLQGEIIRRVRKVKGVNVTRDIVVVKVAMLGQAGIELDVDSMDVERM